jgi:hypothetical protein
MHAKATGQFAMRSKIHDKHFLVDVRVLFSKERA